MQAMYEVKVKRFFIKGRNTISTHNIVSPSYDDAFKAICEFYSFPIVVGAEERGQVARNGLVKVHILSIDQVTGFVYSDNVKQHSYSAIVF